MSQFRISLNFSKYSDAGFLVKAQTIDKGMTNNGYFATPTPTLTTLEDAIAIYSDALVKAAELGRSNVAAKNTARKSLTQLLKQLGAYVTFAGNDVEVALVSSGYSVTSGRVPSHLAITGMVALAIGITSGVMVASLATVAGAYGYLFQICSEPPTESTVWTSYPSPRTSFTFTGLVPGNQYWVRVAATGRRLQISYSPVSTMFAQ